MSYIVNAADKKVSGGKKETPAVKAEPAPKTEHRPQIQRAPAALQSAQVTKESKTAKATLVPAEPNLLGPAMKIISEEIGVEEADLTDDVEFADAGLDSLLSLVISSRMRDELDIEFESSDFLEVGSIGGLKQFLKKYEPEVAVAVTETVTTEHVVPVEEALLLTESQDAGETWSATLKILAEESGIVENDLTDDVAFADVGVDSLMSLVICSRLRDELEIDFPERALFEECQTISDLRTRLSSPSASSPSESSVETPPSGSSSPPLFSAAETPGVASLPTTTPMTDFSDIGETFPVAPRKRQSFAPIPSVIIPPAWSVYLQGSRKQSTKTLFVFPDGCGAATSYLSLPTISPTTALVGFNSPFMK